MINGSALAWHMVMFDVLQSRFDEFGGVLALAAFAGAIAGLVLGRFIDKGHGRRAVLLNAVLVFASMLVRAFCGSEPIAIVAAAVFAAVAGGLDDIPTLMSAVYNMAKASSNPLLFQFAAERGWDVSGALVCLLSAALCASSLGLQSLILLAAPAVVVQAWCSIPWRDARRSTPPDRRLRATYVVLLGVALSVPRIVLFRFRASFDVYSKSSRGATTAPSIRRATRSSASTAGPRTFCAGEQASARPRLGNSRGIPAGDR